ncbi:MAG: glycosyltransferase family A protein [Candidatus Limnocylindria bacterium]
MEHTVADEARDQMPAVGVVIVNHAREDEAVQAVRSALDQDYDGPVVVYFVYNERDGVERLLDRLPERVVTLPYTLSVDENPIAVKRNLALAASTEPFVAFLDDDDLWSPGKLSAHITCMLHHPDAVLCCTGWSIGSDVPAEDSGEPSTRWLTRRDITLARSIVTSSALVRGDAARAARFDSRPVWFAVEDYDLWLRLAPLGPFCKLSPALTVLRPSGDSGSAQDRSAQLLRAASVAAQHLRSDGISRDGTAALFWFLGCACLAERGSTPVSFRPLPVRVILDGGVLGPADRALASVVSRLLASSATLRLGRLIPRGLAAYRRCARL